MLFKDRKDAGSQLAKSLQGYKANPEGLVLGLARGGVVVAAEVAKELQLPLDVVIPRKIGAPGNPELGIGAIMEDGESYFNDRLALLVGASQDYIKKEVAKEKIEAKRRIMLYRRTTAPLAVEGKTVILVDDGIATGATMLAVVRSMRASNAAEIVVAVPVTSQDAYTLIKPEVDQFIYLYAPRSFGAVGNFYDYFDQTSDNEVINVLAQRERSLKHL